MDQQRKVIYERRLQIIDGDDLEEHTEDLLAGAAEKLVAEHCPTEFEEDWDLKGLVDGLMQYYPTKFTVADLEQAATTEDLVESIVEEALDYYEKHGEAMPGGAETMRQIERDVYLQIMDAALARPPGRDGQPQGRHPPALDRPGRPPQRLAAGGLLHVRPADGGHRQRLPALHPPRRGRAAPPRRSPTWTRRCTPPPRTRWPRPLPWPPRWLADQGANVPGDRRPGARPPSASRPAGRPDRAPAKAQIKRPNAPDPDALAPIVKAQTEKVGRNEPCWCGSGKKFKFCHGAA